jgi:hypothetical protein
LPRLFDGVKENSSQWSVISGKPVHSSGRCLLDYCSG